MTDKSDHYGCVHFPLCNPYHWSHRYLVLFFLLLVNFGSYFVYDNPVALQRTIINVMELDVTQYSLLYSVYAWPNVVLAFCGGYLLDRVFGVRLGTVIFSSLVCLGQLLFAVGAFVGHFWLMLAGRFVFGLGGESLIVSQNTYAVLWYKGKELSTVFGLLLSFSGIGGALNMDVNSKIYDNTFSFVSSYYKRLGCVLLIGFGICLVSLLCAIIVGLFDKRAERILMRKKRSSDEKINLCDIKDFPLSLWLVFFINMTYYSTFYTFNGLTLIFLMDKYHFSISEANFVNSLSFIVSVAITVFVGILLDKIGFNLFWVSTGTLAAFAAHAMLGFLGSSQVIPYLTIALRGVTFAVMACALWPLVAHLVPEHQLGTAYGIMQSSQNLGLSLTPIIAGVIIDRSGYLMVEVFYCILLCVTLVASVLLCIVAGNRLNLCAWGSVKQYDSVNNVEQDCKTYS